MVLDFVEDSDSTPSRSPSLPAVGRSAQLLADLEQTVADQLVAGSFLLALELGSLDEQAAASSGRDHESLAMDDGHDRARYVRGARLAPCTHSSTMTRGAP